MTGITYCKTINSLDGWILEQLQINMLMNVVQNRRSVGVYDRPQTHTKTMMCSLFFCTVQKKTQLYSEGLTFREMVKVSGSSKTTLKYLRNRTGSFSNTKGIVM